MEAEPQGVFPENEDIFSFLEKDFSSPQENQANILDRIVEDAYQLFNSYETEELEDGSFKIYDTFAAAFDSMVSLDIDNFTLLGIIGRFTRITPKEALEEMYIDEDYFGENAQDLDMFFGAIAQAYISAELVKKYPHVVEIEEQRLRELGLD